MIRYLIKATYTEGVHNGKTYLLRKGGYVTDEGNIEWLDTTYKTESIARRVCERMYEENELFRKIEREDEAVKIRKGFSPKSSYIYESKTYEPYPVETVDE